MTTRSQSRSDGTNLLPAATDGERGRGRGARGGRGRGAGRGRGIGARGRGRGGAEAPMNGPDVGNRGSQDGTSRARGQHYQEMSRTLGLSAQRAANVLQRGDALIAAMTPSAVTQRNEVRGSNASSRRPVAATQRGEPLVKVPQPSVSAGHREVSAPDAQRAEKGPGLPHRESTTERNTRPGSGVNITTGSARLAQGLHSEKLSQSMKPRGDIHTYVHRQCYKSYGSSLCLGLDLDSQRS